MGRQTRRRRWLSGLLVGSAVSGCALATPLPAPSSLDDRLAAVPTAGLPLQLPVRIYWNEHQVPFIEAETDADGAFALGLVHAHLRLGQMAVYRRIAQGRISEMGGPIAIDIDYGLRLLNYGQAAPAMVTGMPEATRLWLQRFVDGINHYQASARTLPVEYRILGLQPEPWTIEDVLTFGRLAGTDVTWLVWFNLLKLRQRADWPAIWARLVGGGGDRTAPSADNRQDASTLSQVIAEIARSGSNSLAIAPSRTRTGSAILANDPHLGLNLPNTWVLAGLKTPSYHVVGLMVPGLPLFAIGRNERIAWGGTNMRATASDLVDVSHLTDAEVQTRVETIRVRWWFDHQMRLRSTRFGPVLTDAPQLAELSLPPSSLRWTGHLPSDEVTAMLNVARAGSFEEFRAAFDRFSVPGQNMLYADAAGNIGKVLAVQVPDRGGQPPADVIAPAAATDRAWQALRDSRTLPHIRNPETGYIASGNNRPPQAGAEVGWFFSPDDRVDRMATLIEQAGTVDVEQVKAFQRDVYVDSSAALNAVLVRKLTESAIGPTANGEAQRIFELMANWDGHYLPDRQEPVAYELFRYYFTQNFYQSLFGESDWAAFAGVGQIKALMIEDIDSRPLTELAPLMAQSLDAAGETLSTYPTWGEMHRLVLRHPLALLPVIGSRWIFADHPIGGSTDSLMKTAHPATDERHRASYGANARHVSDLSDPDRNWFVLLGGQDGWLNSQTFLDQVPLWLDGRYIEMPLRLETVRARFTRVTELRR